jgi:hypothetical protein
LLDHIANGNELTRISWRSTARGKTRAGDGSDGRPVDCGHKEGTSREYRANSRGSAQR